jgi:hypothetical protein
MGTETTRMDITEPNNGCNISNYHLMMVERKCIYGDFGDG